MSAAADIVAFWREAEPSTWFGRGAAFDRTCDNRFRDAHFAAAAPRFDDWMWRARSEGERAQLGCDGDEVALATLCYTATSCRFGELFARLPSAVQRPEIVDRLQFSRAKQ